VRIFSARCLGVYESGVPNLGRAPGSLAGWAHSEQNLAVGASWVPQFAQIRASGAAHSSQNFACDRFSC